MAKINPYNCVHKWRAELTVKEHKIAGTYPVSVTVFCDTCGLFTIMYGIPPIEEMEMD